jgi:hypothetical protein
MGKEKGTDPELGFSFTGICRIVLMAQAQLSGKMLDMTIAEKCVVTATENQAFVCHRQQTQPPKPTNIMVLSNFTVRIKVFQRRANLREAMAFGDACS